MLVAAESRIVYDADGAEVRLIAGQSHIAEDHYLARRYRHLLTTAVNGRSACRSLYRRTGEPMRLSPPRPNPRPDFGLEPWRLHPETRDLFVSDRPSPV